jgi:hypothetical protein
MVNYNRLSSILKLLSILSIFLLLLILTGCPLRQKVKEAGSLRLAVMYDSASDFSYVYDIVYLNELQERIYLPFMFSTPSMKIIYLLLKHS